jgi:hypothetical protein
MLAGRSISTRRGEDDASGRRRRRLKATDAHAALDLPVPIDGKLCELGLRPAHGHLPSSGRSPLVLTPHVVVARQDAAGAALQEAIDVAVILNALRAPRIVPRRMVQGPADLAIAAPGTQQQGSRG